MIIVNESSESIAIPIRDFVFTLNSKSFVEMLPSNSRYSSIYFVISRHDVLETVTKPNRCKAFREARKDLVEIKEENCLFNMAKSFLKKQEEQKKEAIVPKTEEKVAEKKVEVITSKTVNIKGLADILTAKPKKNCIILYPVIKDFYDALPMMEKSLRIAIRNKFGSYKSFVEHLRTREII